ncbi:NRDE family protein [Flagellimonas taeanensis]|uniref:Transport and Golgi organisation 2 n=2 Tax=Flagellimonas taeanensis TaxID=1005926 RepID=A0A1M6TY96_9FLAO|nr:NRDE family protein [Allomuricauda taeanensis]MEE1962379.1 NRDE family protein [Allomuricauda taeanensis]SHK61768.1 Transport and Golgi organisation 2 [Allomuricauda taeanensis]
MCTVSFVPSGNKYMITSNRDEHISRPLAHEPKEETVGSLKVLFPKDPKAGGTWFALNEMGAAAVLLNGAFVRHSPNGNYARSRGLVLLDIIGAEDPLTMLSEIDLYNIEPFTLVLFHTHLLEFRWDGGQKYFRPLDKSKSHIWSSVTLYDDAVIGRRASLFDGFMKRTHPVEASDVVDFHTNNHEDFENGFIIDRETGLKTFSVTQAILEHEGQGLLKHIDLLNDKAFEVSLSPNQLTV